jgi:hypothetical protein
MIADATLLATLTGGVFTYASLGREGLTRESLAAAFDATTKLLKPCAVVKQRTNTPDGAAVDMTDPMASAVQIVEIWLYQDTGYTSIDAATTRLFDLFFGYQFADSWELALIGGLDRQNDTGQLSGASMARMDWQVNSLM